MSLSAHLLNEIKSRIIPLLSPNHPNYKENLAKDKARKAMVGNKLTGKPSVMPSQQVTHQDLNVAMSATYPDTDAYDHLAKKFPDLHNATGKTGSKLMDAMHKAAKSAGHKDFHAFEDSWKSEMKEEVETLDEISKDTLKSYKSKALFDLKSTSSRLNAFDPELKSKDERSDRQKMGLRIRGLHGATKRLNKEEVELEESVGTKLGEWEHNPSKNYTGPKLEDRHMYKLPNGKCESRTPDGRVVDSGEEKYVMNALRASYKPKLPGVKEAFDPSGRWNGKAPQNLTPQELEDRQKANVAAKAKRDETYKQNRPALKPVSPQYEGESNMSLSNTIRGLIEQRLDEGDPGFWKGKSTAPKGPAPAGTFAADKAAGKYKDLNKKFGDPNKKPKTPVKPFDEA